MEVGSLFSGIGGIDLGLEKAGHNISWQVEINPFCQKVLHKHWPKIPIYNDIEELTDEQLQTLRPVEIIAGGFPCQDISTIGGGAGLAGPRSGLWREMVRTIRVVRPKYVIVENVATLLQRGLYTVLKDLAEIGYNAEWDSIPAYTVGAPHTRDRLFIMAYTNGVAKPKSYQGLQPYRNGSYPRKDFERLSWYTLPGSYWDIHQPPTIGVDNGLSDRVDRSIALGNAVIPQILEIIGRSI